MNADQIRRVHVTVLVKARTDTDAKEIVVGRLNDWFVDPAQRELEADAGYPAGTLLHYTVQPASGHRAVAA